MVNVLGLSRRLLSVVCDFVQWRGFDTFLEFSFHTLSMNLNLTVVSPIELDTLFWRKDYTWNDILNQPNSLFHPVKNWNTQKLCHEKILNERKRYSNDTDWFNLPTWCQNNDDNWICLEKRLTKLILSFNQIKIRFSSNQHRSLRQHFLSLAQKCVKLNDFKSATIITENLADNAYELPDPARFQMITKGKNYLSIEKALLENNKNIPRYPRYSPIVIKLRREATKLIRYLTHQIKQQHNQTYEQSMQRQLNSYHILMENFNNTLKRQS